MITDSHDAPGTSAAALQDVPSASRQRGEQTTLTELACLHHPSWAARAHEKALPSKAEGPSSGLEESTVEGVTLAKWTRGAGKITSDGGSE